MSVFHLELRQFPHTVHTFNLSEEELRAQILVPWMAGGTFQWGERRWSPEKARLTVLSGRRLAPEELGMGRGWANALRAGEAVTERLLAALRPDPASAQSLEACKEDLRRACGRGPVTLGGFIGRLEERWPQARLSERLALAEQAVWELLHEGRIEVVDPGAQGVPREASAPVPRERWRAMLFRWEAWSAAGDGAPWLRLAHSGPPAEPGPLPG